MDPQLHEYLEGERPASALSDEARRRAAGWDALLEAVRAPERPLPWLEGRVMHAVTARASRPAWRPRVTRLWSSRWAAGLAAALAVVALVLVRRGSEPAAPVADSPMVDQSVILVQFALEAPGARTVSLTGSFNGWAIRATPLSDTDGDGLWTALVPLGPGLHQYMFVVDDVEWVTDPRAGRYVDDGFGRANAVIAVAQPSLPAS